MSLVVTVFNQKGGVGKTSTCYHLAGALQKLGRRVLLVDNDPQASLTQGFFGQDHTLAMDPAGTVAALYAGARFIPGLLVKQAGSRVGLLAGSAALAEFNAARPERCPGVAQRCLADRLGALSFGYDLVLVDTPPNLNLCSWAALAASDALVVPLQAEDFGAQGLGPVRGMADSIRERLNPRLRLLGYLVNKLDRRLALHKLYEAQLRELYGGQVFASVVPLLVAYPEAIYHHTPVSLYQPRGAAARAIEAVAAELLARLAAAVPPPSQAPLPLEVI